MRHASSSGFTLIELMIVIAIIGILGAIAMPTFAILLSRAQEASSKGNLGLLRVAISGYIGAQEGVPPSDLSLLIPDYMPSIPPTLTPGLHPANASVNVPISYTFYSGMSCIPYNPESYLEGGGWLYRFPNAGLTTNGTLYGYCEPGTVVINCSHEDSRGVVWGSY